MAKRGTLEHPKTKKLARALTLPSWAALGLLEAFWQWVGRYTPTGFLSIEDMLDCADTIRFDGDLGKTLESCGLLEIADGGWYVHDWHDHADDLVKKTLAKRGESFANGSAIRNQNNSRTDSESFANQSRINRDKPSPEPVASSQKPGASSPTVDDGGLASRFLEGVAASTKFKNHPPELEKLHVLLLELQARAPNDGAIAWEFSGFFRWHDDHPSKAKNPNCLTSFSNWCERNFEKWDAERQKHASSNGVAKPKQKMTIDERLARLKQIKGMHPDDHLDVPKEWLTEAP